MPATSPITIVQSTISSRWKFGYSVSIVSPHALGEEPPGETEIGGMVSRTPDAEVDTHDVPDECIPQPPSAIRLAGGRSTGRPVHPQLGSMGKPTMEGACGSSDWRRSRWRRR